MGISDHLTCLLRNLYAGQEAIVRTGHGTTDWFQIGKWASQGCILSPCLFNLYAEYIMRNAGLEEAQAGIKIAGREINNLRYADDTTLMASTVRGVLKIKKKKRSMSDVPEEGSTQKRERQATVRGGGKTSEQTPLTSITCRILQWLPRPVFQSSSHHYF